ncbi:MAG: cytidylyltransferase domain-containing protein [Ardenticatenaceae bacterium]
MNKFVGIITARGGSKSIPRKNVKLLAGKPLIAWTIEAALQSDGLNRVIVSTDDQEIAQVARQWGAEVPFMRPAELAQDETPSIFAILHTVNWLDKFESYQPDFVMCLQPTSPLRTAQDIDAVIELTLQKKVDSVVSVTPVDHHPYWVKKVDDNGRIHDFVTLNQPISRRQDLPAVYGLNGSIYLAHREVLLERKGWYTEQTLGYIMPPKCSFDIDTPWDFYLVDLILKDRAKREND